MQRQRIRSNDVAPTPRNHVKLSLPAKFTLTLDGEALLLMFNSTVDAEEDGDDSGETIILICAELGSS